jgi:hypothetical protein
VLTKRRGDISFVAEGPLEQFQIDLIYMPKSWFNNGFKYIFACIDVFSKYLMVEKLKDKNAKTTLEAFIKIFDKTKRVPKQLQTDDGKEFVTIRPMYWVSKHLESALEAGKFEQIDKDFLLSELKAFRPESEAEDNARAVENAEEPRRIMIMLAVFVVAVMMAISVVMVMLRMVVMMAVVVMMMVVVLRAGDDYDYDDDYDGGDNHDDDGGASGGDDYGYDGGDADGSGNNGGDGCDDGDCDGGDDEVGGGGDGDDDDGGDETADGGDGGDGNGGGNGDEDDGNDEGGDGGDVGNDSGKFHPHLQIRHGVDPILKLEYLETGARIAPWLGQFLHDILKGWDTYRLGNILLKNNLAAQGLRTHQVLHRGFEVLGHLLHQFVALGMHG